MDYSKYEVDVEINKKDWREYRRLEKEQDLVFKQDLRVYAKLENLPDFMWERVYQLAWELGHSFGYPEVTNVCVEVATLFEGVVIMEK